MSYSENVLDICTNSNIDNSTIKITTLMSLISAGRRLHILLQKSLSRRLLQTSDDVRNSWFNVAWVDIYKFLLKMIENTCFLPKI